MDRAVSLSRERGTALIVLHVMDTPWLTKLAQPDWRSLQQANRETALGQLQLDLLGADVELKVLIEIGNPIEVIERVVNEQQCALIVSGTARDETLGRVVLGNTVERLARRCSIPLLVVRMRPSHAYKQVLVATDFSDGARAALTSAHALLPTADLTLYHAFDQVAGIYELDQPTIEEAIVNQQNKARLFAAAINNDASDAVKVVVEHGSPQQRLPAYVDDHPVDLVVLGTQGATGMVRAAMGSVAENLLASLRCDVMVVPRPAH
jgi:nucleotide-binding universal stress UspA family protein